MIKKKDWLLWKLITVNKKPAKRHNAPSIILKLPFFLCSVYISDFTWFIMSSTRISSWVFRSNLCFISSKGKGKKVLSTNLEDSLFWVKRTPALVIKYSENLITIRISQNKRKNIILYLLFINGQWTCE